MSGLGLGLAIAGGIIVTGIAGAAVYATVRRPAAPGAAVGSTSATVSSLNPNAGLPYSKPSVATTSYLSDVGDAVDTGIAIGDALERWGAFA